MYVINQNTGTVYRQL